MASLRSMIVDGHMAPAHLQEDQQKYSRYLDLTRQALRSHDTILVNASPVVEDLQERFRSDRSFLDRRLIPCPKPPYRAMWLEYSKKSVRFGRLVRRIDLSANGLNAFAAQSLISYDQETLKEISRLDHPTIVEVICWDAGRGYVEPGGDFVYWLNAEGDWQDSTYGRFGPLPESFSGIEDINKPEFEHIRLDYGLIGHAEYAVLHTFARLNCHNVKLLPMSSGVSKPRKPGYPPFSVWHEIVVTGLPELRRQEKAAVPDDEVLEVRFHKVRGHYADYTRGKGLFGRLRVRIWVEEHAAGNPELGTVVSSYRVEK